ncbi:MAG: dipeptide ABC transporter ATP-binding protein [Acidimicrobiaceae bacterium]|nr:dipeptide ABC transporter ATP-binding protein [Acidimicrobiaceae bacterium]
MPWMSALNTAPSRCRARMRPATLILASAGAVMLALVIGAAVFADLLASHPPDRSSGLPYQSPSSQHWLGTDDLGRDLWAQLVFGARVSLWVGLVAAVAATLLGTAVALLAGWRRGWLDAVLMRLVDLTLSLPFLVLVLVLAAYFGRGLEVLIVLIAGVLWARPARLLRSQVLKISQYGHTEAAHAMGAGSLRIMTIHISRRLAPLIVSQFVRAAAVAVIVQSGVAFLGLGDPGRVSWGSTLYFANNGSAILTDAWLWWIVPPGAALTILIVGLAFVGFAFEELADPQLSSHGWRPPRRRRISETLPEPCSDDVRLDIRDLSVDFNEVTVVRDVDLRVGRGRTLGLVGESGSGKSTLGLAVAGLVAPPGRVEAAAVMLGDVDLRRLGRRGLEKIRGREIAIVPQAAMSVLDPTMTIRDQTAEAAVSGASVSGSAAGRTDDRAQARRRAEELLTLVGLPRERHKAFAHQLSGGQRQRVVIAMAVINRPKLVIADEATSGLDVINQQAILDLLDELRLSSGFDLWLISHDLPLVASRADDLVVMYGGRVVEAGPTGRVTANPQHPYTSMLLQALPALGSASTVLQPVPGEVPDPAQLPAGCAFAPRCPRRRDDCTSIVPVLRHVDAAQVACHYADDRSAVEHRHGATTMSPATQLPPHADPRTSIDDTSLVGRGSSRLPQARALPTGPAEVPWQAAEPTPPPVIQDANPPSVLPRTAAATPRTPLSVIGSAGPAGSAGSAIRATAAALRLDGVSVVYSGRHAGRGGVTALDGVSLRIGERESVAVIGRSAAGKSTVARLAVGLTRPSAGSVEVLGRATGDLSQRELRRLRQRVQMVFQDPYDSLHPNMTVAALIGEPLAIAGVPRRERHRRVLQALRHLGLPPVDSFLSRHPRTLSGGQRQRVALARTLVAKPEFIVADEPASMLDASLRATVAAHLLEVREALGATLVFITHDISLARLVAERIVVLSEGRVVEDGPAAQVVDAPSHPETRALIEAAGRSRGAA